MAPNNPADAGAILGRLAATTRSTAERGRRIGEALTSITIPGEQSKTIDAARNRMASLSKLTALQARRTATTTSVMEQFQRQIETYTRDIGVARDREQTLKADLARSIAAFQDRSKLKQIDGQWWTDGTNRFKEPSAVQTALAENMKEQKRIAEAFNRGQFALQQRALGTVATVDPRDADKSVRVDMMVNKILERRFQYAWGGGGPEGPSLGVGDDGGDATKNKDWEILGFDCSGLTAFLHRQTGGSTIGITSEAQYAEGKPTTNPKVGDLVFPGDSFGPGGPKHVMFYLGNGMALEAPSSGLPLRVVPVEPGAQFRSAEPTAPDAWAVRRHGHDPQMGLTADQIARGANPYLDGQYGQGSPYAVPAPVE